MAITRQQLLNIGFVPSKRSRLLNRDSKYDTLIYKINDTDFLFIGYNNFNKRIDFKRLWKTIKIEEEFLTYPVDKIGELSLNTIQEYIEFCKAPKEHPGEDE